jgi:hypothetical protein
VVSVLEDVGREMRAAIDEDAARLQRWFGKTRLVPRFRLLVALTVTTLMAGCGGGGPTPTPGDMVDVLAELQAHGATVNDVVADDAGCPDQSLYDNARRIELKLAADGQSYEVFLFRWLDGADYTSAASAFYLCVSSFANRGTSVHVETVEVSPWRAYGPDWSRDMHDALQEALSAAATGQ